MPEAGTQTSLAHAGSGGPDWRGMWTLGANQVSRVPESGWPLPLSRKCGMRNSERGMGKEKWQMTNGGWQMTNGGWRMGDCKCRDETDHPGFPGARKWLAPSALSADLLAGWG